MSVEAWVQGNRPGGSGRSPGERKIMKNNRKCMPPVTNRGATYTWD